MDSKAEYSALSSTRSQKNKLKQTTQCPFNTVQVKIREVSPETRCSVKEATCIRIKQGNSRELKKNQRSACEDHTYAIYQQLSTPA